MKKNIAYLAAIFLLSISIVSCSYKISYIGNRFTPSNNIDFYADQSAIKKEYEVIGRGYLLRGFSPGGRFYEKIQLLAIGKAKEIGADAVLFKDVFCITPVKKEETFTANNGESGINLPATVNQSQPSFTLFFLKYK